MMRVKRLLVALAVALLFAAPAAAGPRSHHETMRDGPLNDGHGFPPIVDFVLTRPFGLGCVVGGTAMFAALLPFNALADLYVPGAPHIVSSTGFLVHPVRYTFVDPLGTH